MLRVHRSALLIDTHNDAPSKTIAGLDFNKLSGRTHTDLPRLQQGGVGAVFFSAYVAASYTASNQSAERARRMIASIRNDIVAKNSGAIELVTTADGIAAAHRAGKIAALIGIEGGHAIEDSLETLRDFYSQGARYLTLTHSNSNHWADSSGDPRKPNNGLSAFGKQVIAEMNRLGMMVDISHVSDKTFWDVLAISRAPVFASHSSCRALVPIARNMSDEMIAALAKRGGVVQINFNCAFLSVAYARNKSAPRPTVDSVVAHIRHVVKLAGIDHVGIGSDFDGVQCVPQGLDDPSKFPVLTRKLLEAGFLPADIRKIYGENTLRLMRDVERTALSMRK